MQVHGEAVAAGGADGDAQCAHSHTRAQVPGLRDLRVGRAFGSGFMAQNRIYQLLDATTGRNAGLVLKVEWFSRALHAGDSGGVLYL
jgi:hypothetical protein